VHHPVAAALLALSGQIPPDQEGAIFLGELSLARLATHFRDYHPIEPNQAAVNLDADPPAYAEDFMDIKG
jgi:hypothetical protein